MGDGYTASLPRRWRAVFVLGSVAASAPVVAYGSAPFLATGLILVQALVL